MSHVAWPSMTHRFGVLMQWAGEAEDKASNPINDFLMQVFLSGIVPTLAVILATGDGGSVKWLERIREPPLKKIDTWRPVWYNRSSTFHFINHVSVIISSCIVRVSALLISSHGLDHTFQQWRPVINDINDTWWWYLHKETPPKSQPLIADLLSHLLPHLLPPNVRQHLGFSYITSFRSIIIRHFPRR